MNDRFAQSVRHLRQRTPACNHRCRTGRQLRAGPREDSRHRARHGHRAGRPRRAAAGAVRAASAGCATGAGRGANAMRDAGAVRASAPCGPPTQRVLQARGVLQAPGSSPTVVIGSRLWV